MSPQPEEPAPLQADGPSAAALVELAKGRAGRAACLKAQIAPARHRWWGHLERAFVGDAWKSFCWGCLGKSWVGMLKKVLVQSILEAACLEWVLIFLHSGIPQSQILLF